MEQRYEVARIGTCDSQGLILGKKIWSIPPRRLNHPVLDEELTRLGLDCTGSQDIRVERMATWIDQNCDPDELVDCDCGGTSDTSHFTRCPFCGDEEVELLDGTTVDSKQLSLRRFDGDAVVEFGVVQVLTEASLDESVKAICTLKDQMAKNYHRLGVMLRNVHDSGLWKMRMSKDGKPKYADYGQWTRAEVGLGRTQATKCIDVATNFSEKEVKEIGHTRLAIALQVPPQYRDRLVAQAREGASKRDLEREVAVVTGRVDTETKFRGNSITLALTTGTRTIRMIANDGTDEPAVCVGDKPVGSEILGNDVIQEYSIVEDSDGTLVIVINCRRLDDE